MAFCAGHHNPVVSPLHNTDKQVRVRLQMRRQAPVPFRVCHSAIYREVLVLNHLQKFHQILVIVRSILFIHLKRGRKDRIEGVHPDTPLKAGGGLLTQQALHLHLLYQVLGRLVQMSKPVDFMPCQTGYSRHQLLISGVLGQRVGHGHTVDGGPNHRVVHPVVNLLSKQIHPCFKPAQAFDILLCCHQRHFFAPHLFLKLNSSATASYVPCKEFLIYGRIDNCLHSYRFVLRKMRGVRGVSN